MTVVLLLIEKVWRVDQKYDRSLSAGMAVSAYIGKTTVPAAPDIPYTSWSSHTHRLSVGMRWKPYGTFSDLLDNNPASTTTISLVKNQITI